MLSFIDQLTERVGRAVSWLTLVLVLVVAYDVFMRYFFSQTSAAMVELEWHLYALIFLLGAGYGLKHDRHVRVDVFYSRFSDRKKAVVNLVGYLIFLVPFAVLLLINAWPFVANSWAIREGSPDPGGLPARYLIKAAIPLGVALLLLQALGEIVRNLRLLRTPTQTPQA